MHFLIEDENLLKKSNIYLDKVCRYTKKELDSIPAYNKNFLKTKIKFYDDEATDFHDKEIPKVGYNHTFLAVTTIYSALKKMKTINLKCF